MNRAIKFILAGLLTISLAVVGNSVWAGSQKKAGSLPPKPITGGIPVTGGDCSAPINMITAIFTAQENSCIIAVALVAKDSSESVLPPEGLVFVSDIFHVTMDPATASVQVCYAYPPDLAAKDAKVYSLSSQKAWVEIQNAVVKDNAICVISGAGYFSLIGKP